ncbi:MAG: hypothetical protein RRX93_05160 [Bacteroidales bacterium]
MFSYISRKVKLTIAGLFSGYYERKQILKNMYITMVSQEVRELLQQEKYLSPMRLERFGAKVFSQNDEDGIIQEIFNRIGITNKTFIEIGVGDGLENNTYYLLLQSWKGCWIEASAHNVKKIKNTFDSYLANNSLNLIEAFVNKYNINALLDQAKQGKEPDLFCLDIDSNDYHVMESLQVINPRVIVLEYNAKILPEVSWYMSYNEHAYWDGSDNFGASLLAFYNLMERKGYHLVGTNITGSNAFFVRKDLVQNYFYEPASPIALYNAPRYHLTPGFVVGHPSKQALRPI